MAGTCVAAGSYAALFSGETSSLFMFLWRSFWCLFVYPFALDPSPVLPECPGYVASNVLFTDSAVTADLRLAGQPCNVYGNDIAHLSFRAEYQTTSRVHVMIFDEDEMVYQVPESVVPRPQGSISSSESLLSVNIIEEPFSFSISRKDSNEILFDTSGSSLIFEDQYLRLRTSLPPEPMLYGLGEHTDSLMLNTTDYTRTLWCRDSGQVPEGSNLYGDHPVYFENRPSSGGAHGVVLLNSNGMDIKINAAQDGQYLEYNAIGGVVDLYFMAGPDPFDVARQYSEIAGRPAMVPYWGFGLHQCRFGYQDVYEIAEVVSNYSAAGIPLETMWADIDYMDRFKVFTLDPANFPLQKMRELVDYLHEHEQHFVVMVDPAVAYQDYDTYNRGAESGAFLTISNGSVYQGVVWPGPAVYPDWFGESTQAFWTHEFALFFNESSGLDIDALWIDMNEPSNFCPWPCDDPEGFTKSAGWINNPPPPSRNASERPAIPGFPEDFQPSAVEMQVIGATKGKKKGLPGRDLINPKYRISNDAGSLSSHTASTDLIHSNGLAEYDTHNLYGLMMSSASRTAMLARRPSKRPLIITRSTFIGAGTHVAHWLGDNVSSWAQYRASIRHMLQFTAFFQVPMVGADVCGFQGDTSETLCARWAALGGFYPFYRNHNDKGGLGQEFYRWPLVAEAARGAIELRYRLLDYIYTAMHKQSVDGTPLLAPLWFHYPRDLETSANELQFFYGPSLLVSPVTHEGATSVDIYLPDDVFYSLSTLRRVPATGRLTLRDIPYTEIPVHVRGGRIVALRERGALTTARVRREDFELLIAPGEDGWAEGEVYVDDGESLVQEGGGTEVWFRYGEGVLEMGGRFGYELGEVKIGWVTVMGEGEPVRKRLGLRMMEVGGGFRVEIDRL